MVTPVAGLAPVPAGWADEQALGLVLNWATALAALKPLGRLSAGKPCWCMRRRVVSAVLTALADRATIGKQALRP